MAKLHVLLLVHQSLIPPDDLATLSPSDAEACRTEFDVYHCLSNDLKHTVTLVGIHDELAPLQQALDQKQSDKEQPDIVFNLMEEFAGNPAFDYYIASYLEMRGIPYTGCNPAGLMLSRDKAKSKMILAHHGIPVPEFMQVAQNTTSNKIRPDYPLIVKSLTHEGSIAIARASVVKNNQQLEQRIKHIHDTTQSDAIAEQFIPGREIYVTLTGNTRLTAYPFRELIFNKDAPEHHNIATSQVKWSEKFRQRHGITYQACQPLPDGVEKRIVRLCKQAYKALTLNGYARFDLRLTSDNSLYMLEANPNPGIARNEETVASAAAVGMSYPQLIQHILTLGLQAYKKRQFPVPRQ